MKHAEAFSATTFWYPIFQPEASIGCMKRWIAVRELLVQCGDGADPGRRTTAPDSRLGAHQHETAFTERPQPYPDRHLKWHEHFESLRR